MFRIALAQMDVKLADPDANRDTARRMVDRAAGAGADLVVLPELWGSGYDLAHAADYATPLHDGQVEPPDRAPARRDDLFGQMAAWAREHGLYVTGSLLEARRGRVYNTCALYGPEGLVGHYRKIHLFRLMDEDQYLASGDRPALCDGLPWGKTALAVCYDLRFPELFRRYAVAGARLMVIPAQWPVRRIDHWRALLRARAIENQCVVAGCNRVGTDPAPPGTDRPGAVFGGASAVVGPWGEGLAQGDDRAALLLAEVDFQEVTRARRHIPVMGDRRPECYTR